MLQLIVIVVLCVVSVQSIKLSPRSTRQQFTQDVAQSMTVLSSLLMAPLMVRADSMNDVNSKLNEYKLPPILYVPSGFNPLVSEYGRGNIKEKMQNPILVQFFYPSLWVTAKTSVNNNGEAGTISAGQYAKGDSSFLYVQPSAPGETLDTNNKNLIAKFVLKSLSQKGDPVEDFKVGSVRQGSSGADGTKYILADISYKLNTEAGFLISRQGVVSLTSVRSFILPIIHALILTLHFLGWTIHSIFGFCDYRQKMEE